MDFCANLGRFLVAFINVIFMLISLVFLAGGCILKFGWDGLLKDKVEPIIKGMTKAAKDAGFGEVDTKGLDISQLVSDIAIPFIVIGCVFFVLAIFGLCGACCKVKWMILAYTVILIVLLLAQIIFVIILFKSDEVTNKIKEPLVQGLQEKYTGFNGTDIVSLGWNFLMVSLGCCGLNDYTDFNKAKVWNRQYRVPELNMTKTLKAPVACCKLEGTFPDVQKPDNYNCTFDPKPDTSNYEKGCYKAVLELLAQYESIAIGVGVGVGLFQLILIVFSILIYCGIEKENKIRPV